MPKLILNQEIIDDSWTLITGEESLAELENISSQSIIPVNVWLENKDTFTDKNIAVYLDADGNLDLIKDQLESIPMIALNFPAFTDGRAYSLARRLRTRYNYTGDIRAVGDVLLDQLFYMQRCGFNSFSLREASHYETALDYLSTIELSYQASSDERVSILQQRLSA